MFIQFTRSAEPSLWSCDELPGTDEEEEGLAHFTTGQLASLPYSGGDFKFFRYNPENKCQGQKPSENHGKKEDRLTDSRTPSRVRLSKIAKERTISNQVSLDGCRESVIHPETRSSRLLSLKHKKFATCTIEQEPSLMESKNEFKLLYPKTTYTNQLSSKLQDSRVSSAPQELDTIVDVDELLLKNSDFMEYYNTVHGKLPESKMKKGFPRKGNPSPLS